MKKLLMAMAAAMMLLGCEREESLTTAKVNEPKDSVQVKKITFTFGEISKQPMTRGTLQDASITDLWLFDYMGEELKQTIHQSSTDNGFGSVAVTADTGDHSFCFIASRGTGATVSGGAITWEKPSDTFWAKTTLTITPTTATSQSVELQRVATKLKITITDEVPATLSKLTITADTWHSGINALTGEPTAAAARTSTINVPASYVGTTGQLVASIFGICGDDYTTDVSVTASDANSQAIASVTLDDVPMKKNTTTSYSGPLFTRQPTFSMTVADSWGEDIEDTW
jgi:hypothetical protein